MLVTPLEIVTLVRPVQSQNTAVPILLTVPGMVKPVRAVHLKNAASLILVTVLEMDTSVRAVQSANAKTPMLVTPFPIVIFRMLPLISSQGFAVPLKSNIFPVPLMASVPVALSKVQVSLSPQEPLVVSALARTAAAGKKVQRRARASRMLRMRVFISVSS